jgi:PPM family protein phosphatase
MRFDIAARAILGKRSSQQDAWRVYDERGTDLGAKAETGSVPAGDRTLVIVADGVGGYAGGEEASKLACDAFASSFLKGQGTVEARLRQALDTANAAIGTAQRQQPDKKDMSTTFIGIYLDNGKMTFVSVGDSLLLRYRDEEIHRVNLDHSYADVLDRRLLGSDDPRQWAVAINDDQRAAITLALSGGPLDRAEYGHSPQIAARPLLPGDVIIAASDGIETIDMVQLQNFVRQLAPKGASGIAEGLIKAADGIGPHRRREPDNTTIVIVQVPAGGAARSLVNEPTIVRRVASGVKFSPAMVIGALAAAAVLISAGLYFLVSRLRVPVPPEPPAVVAPDIPVKQTPKVTTPDQPTPTVEDRNTTTSPSKTKPSPEARPERPQAPPTRPEPPRGDQAKPGTGNDKPRPCGEVAC